MPNVLLYMSDEHNPRIASIHGHPVVATPNMERLAQRGTVFENSYCPSPLCAPSRASFMAGRPVHQVRQYNNCSLRRFDYPSYGSVLANDGVHTVHIGKVDAYNDSAALGFSELHLPHDRTPPGDTNFSRKPLTIRANAHKRANGYGPKEHAFSGDLEKIDRAVAWLAETAPHIDQSWTLTVHTSKPHFPHKVTPALWDKYEGHGDLPQYGVDEPSANHPYARDLRDHFQTDRFTAAQIRGLRRGYLGCVDFVDQQLGRLLDALEVSGQLDDTVVIYTSDHGEMLGTFGMWWKCSLYEDSVRVPLIASGPGFAAGSRVKTPVTLLDAQAAIFAAVGRPRPQDWWGTPLQEIPQDDPERLAFAEYHGHGVRSGAFMLRKGPWKLLYNMEAPHQLFDLAHDPHELHNMAAERPEKRDELEQDLRRLCDPEAENRRAHAFEETLKKELDQ